jgi:hypothetical protein
LRRSFFESLCLKFATCTEGSDLCFDLDGTVEISGTGFIFEESLKAVRVEGVQLGQRLLQFGVRRIETLLQIDQCLVFPRPLPAHLGARTG